MSRAVCSVEAEPCDDCNPLQLEDRWLHSPSCPIGVNLLRDAAADRAWFAANPARRKRTRPLTWAETVVVRRALVAMHCAADYHEVDVEWGLDVVVTRHGDGQIRRFTGVALVLSDSSGDEVPVPRSVQVRDERPATNVLAGAVA